MICLRASEVGPDLGVLSAAVRAVAALRRVWTLVSGTRTAWPDRVALARPEPTRPCCLGTMGQLAAISHEIKQPLAAATTNAMACSRWLARDQPNLSEARASAERIIKDMDRALEIVDRMSSLFRRAGHRREPVDVNEVARETLADLGSEAERHSVSIGVELALDLPTIAGDRVQLQQVFVNLVRNAIEAMQETGGELRVSSERVGSGVLLSISDTGVGLPSSGGEAIFEAFFTTKCQGTGIGLSISRCIVESHGGRLWAEQKAQGATFHFTLPDTRGP